MTIPHVGKVAQQLYDLRPQVLENWSDLNVVFQVFLLLFGCIGFDLCELFHLNSSILIWLIVHSIDGA